MSEKPVTKIDPKEKLSHYLNYQSQQKKSKHKKNFQVSTSLKQLHAERRKSLFKRLGLIIVISLMVIVCLSYYVSPLANVKQVKVVGADDLSSLGIVNSAGIGADKKVVSCLLNKHAIQRKISNRYSEVKKIKLSLNKFNQLTLQVKEYKTIGYIKTGDRYHKILTSGKVGTNLLAKNKIEAKKPLFIGYDQDFSLVHDIKLLNSLPRSFKNQVSMLSGNTKQKSQIVFVMKDGNVVIGNAASIKDKLRYYDDIKKKAGKNSVIDMEVGAFSRPLTFREKKQYGIT